MNLLYTYPSRKIFRLLPGVAMKPVPKPSPEIVEGHQSRNEIGRLCRKYGFTNVMIITDKVLYSLGFHETVVRSLEDSGIRYGIFNDIASEPDDNIIDAALKAVRESGAQCIIAIGGGSVIDTSKMVASGARFKRRRASSLRCKLLFVPGGTLPLISVPSTAGTGTEITTFAMVTNPATGAKGSTVLIGLNVKAVVLDSELTISAPASITAACGIDALSHGIEGCIAAVHAKGKNADKCWECVRLVFENLPRVMDNPDNIEARLAMCRAAYYGGHAINIQLVGYVHSFAHSIGAMYHIPHGNAIALCLIPVLEWLKPYCIAKYADMSRMCGFSAENENDAVAADRFLAEVSALMKKCGLSLDGGMIRDEDYDRLTELIAKDSFFYSTPKAMKVSDIRDILNNIRKQ